jgi:predicted DNA-binding transcriptional regulator YafY
MREQLLDTSQLQPEYHLPIQGIEHIPELLRALLLRRVIVISYVTFKGKQAKTYRIRPVLLREDKQYWYILGFPTSDQQVITLALDRIKQLTVTDEGFDSIVFDAKGHFQHAMGITVDGGQEALDVVLSFESYQGNYLRKIPFHGSQKILIDSEDEFRINVKVQPTFEFYSKLFGYADKVKVLSPDHIVRAVRDRLSAALTAYAI